MAYTPPCLATSLWPPPPSASSIGCHSMKTDVGVAISIRTWSRLHARGCLHHPPAFRRPPLFRTALPSTHTQREQKLPTRWTSSVPEGRQSARRASTPEEPFETAPSAPRVPNSSNFCCSAARATAIFCHKTEAISPQKLNTHTKHRSCAFRILAAARA